MKAHDLTGIRFGRLSVLHPSDKVGKHHRWLCRCDCGSTVSIRTDVLTRGLANGCGCIRRSGANHRTHGMHHSPEFTVWVNAKQRCHNPANRQYGDYGARGIVMCDRWRESFAAFFADMGVCPPGYSIERRDNDGPYSPDNCYWAPRLTQANNKRNNRILDIHGTRFTLAEAARHFNVPYWRIAGRLRRGIPPEQAVRP